uniref:Uncharacterized protein n=1 Tax=Angiostrongylus cantonensis TaxID=6313 RepID=A0A0K0D878_ANGCA
MIEWLPFLFLMFQEPGVEKMLNKNSEPEKLKEKDDPAFSRRRKQSFRDEPLVKLANNLRNGRKITGPIYENQSRKSMLKFRKRRERR